MAKNAFYDICEFFNSKYYAKRLFNPNTPKNVWTTWIMLMSVDDDRSRATLTTTRVLSRPILFFFFVPQCGNESTRSVFFFFGPCIHLKAFITFYTFNHVVVASWYRSFPEKSIAWNKNGFFFLNLWKTKKKMLHEIR